MEISFSAAKVTTALLSHLHESDNPAKRGWQKLATL
jgi:hypothetical protein